jgi:hypothetical protein
MEQGSYPAFKTRLQFSSWGDPDPFRNFLEARFWTTSVLRAARLAPMSVMAIYRQQ